MSVVLKGRRSTTMIDSFFTNVSAGKLIARGWRTFGVALATAVFLFGICGKAQAGLADTPLPAFSNGNPSVSVLEVPGVVSRNNVETVFFCTSLASTGADIGVELFDAAGVLLNSVSSDNGAISQCPLHGTDKYPGWQESSPRLGSNGPLRGQKAHLYEGGIRTPTVINWRGQLESGARAQPFHGADWMPTTTWPSAVAWPRQP